MAFYDNCNFDGLKFLSQLKDKPGDFISEPCAEFLSAIQQFKSLAPSRNLVVAELGIGYGATALQVLKMLGEKDVYYCFDFEDTLQAFLEDLQARDFGIKCQVVTVGNSSNLWDSYSWSLSDLVLQMREENLCGIFDVVYLDGAHTLFHDGLAVCLLKELLKNEGVLVLDDVFWSFMNSQWRQGYGVGKLTQEQMADYQILRVRKLFLDNDPNFESLLPPDAYRGVFQKRPRLTKENNLS